MTRLDAEILDELEDVLRQHVGPSNAITSSELAAEAGIKDSEANPATREAIRVLCEQRELPVAASARGYYLIEDRGQLEEYLENLDGRIAGIQQRKQLVAAAWNRSLYGEEVDA
jgi:hypothetical protein